MLPPNLSLANNAPVSERLQPGVIYGKVANHMTRSEDIKSEDSGIVSTALPSREEARRIAQILLTEKLAACVQLLEMESHYVWQGATMAEPEVMLLAKTRAALFETVIARIKALHPYEVPEIVAQPFTAGFAPYLAWIADSTDREML